MQGRARLDELIGLVLALEERDGLDERERRRLDRQIGASSASLGGLSRLRHWLAEAPSESLRHRMRRVRSALAGLQALLAGVGLFLGWAAAAALLSFEVHTGRINIVLAWGLLAAAPFLTWAVSLLGWSLSRWLGSDDGAPSLSEFTGRFSVGRFALRLLPASIRDDVEVVMGRFTAHGRLYGRVERGEILRWSQVFGLAFSLGALVATLAFVVFTDLAFGWSTTLDIASQSVFETARALALPWAAIWPDASPSLELVESTRYFRVSPEDHDHLIDPIVYGGWWPFLVMSIVTYAVVPRGLGLLLVSLLQGRETARAMGRTLGVDRLMDRLETPLVEGQALEAERDVGQPSRDLVPEVDVRQWIRDQQNLRGEVVCVRWAEVPGVENLSSRGAGSEAETGLSVFDAGGRCSLDDDAAAIEATVRARASLVFCVRGYEPPVLDVLDFLAAWRKRAGEAAGLCVVLVGGDARDRDTWRRKLIGLGDPGVVVGSLEEVDA